MYRLRSFIWLKFNILLAPAFAKDTLIEIPVQAPRFCQGNSSLSDWNGFIRANLLRRNNKWSMINTFFAIACDLRMSMLNVRLLAVPPIRLYYVRSEIHVRITPAIAKNHSQIRDADERAECRNFRERSITVSS